MNIERLAKEVKDNIFYKISKLDALCKERKKTNEKFLREIMQSGPFRDHENATLNQAFTDAILNSVASLIDYYCIYCLIKIGVPESKITKIQYRALNNRFLIDTWGLSKVERESTSIEALRKKFDAEISRCCDLKIEDIDPNDYWVGFLGSAISSTLHEYGVVNEKRMSLKFDKAGNRLVIEKALRQYYFYMNFLFCNPANRSGVRYNIYIDINNCLKHNVVPYLTPKVESFESEQRIFSYLEIKNHNHIFLKNGIFRSIVEADFDILSKSLELKLSNRENYDFLCPLEKEWGIGPIITIDAENGCVSEDKATLYFFVDGVLMAKNREATLVDADHSLLWMLSDLIRKIKNGMQLDFRSL